MSTEMAVVGWAAAVALPAVCKIGVAAQARAQPPPASPTEVSKRN